jgi:DNA repair protein SbcD/Mre11
MKFVLFSDLHLDAPFVGLSRNVAARRRQALRDTIRNIAALVNREQADALLCGGDLYEQEAFTDDTMQFVRKLFADLDPLPVYLAPGNHDWLGRTSLYERAAWTPNVHVFKSSSLAPTTLSDGLTLWGAAHHAPAGTEGFLNRFQVDRGGVNLALFHGSENGWFSEQGEGKDPHAPFDEAQIASSGLNHAFLGHYHRAKAGPSHTYPGNPCPLSFGEDSGRGAVVITVQQDGSVQRKWHDVAACQVHDLTINVTGCASSQDLRDLLASRVQGMEGCARVALVGELSPDVELNRQSLDTVTSSLDALVLRLDQVHSSYDFDRLRQEPTVRGQFVRDVLAAAELDDEQRRRVLATGLRALDSRTDLEVA